MRDYFQVPFYVGAIVSTPFYSLGAALPESIRMECGDQTFSQVMGGTKKWLIEVMEKGFFSKDFIKFATEGLLS